VLRSAEALGCSDVGPRLCGGIWAWGSHFAISSRTAWAKRWRDVYGLAFLEHQRGGFIQDPLAKAGVASGRSRYQPMRIMRFIQETSSRANHSWPRSPNAGAATPGRRSVCTKPGEHAVLWQRRRKAIFSARFTAAKLTSMVQRWHTVPTTGLRQHLGSSTLVT